MNQVSEETTEEPRGEVEEDGALASEGGASEGRSRPSVRGRGPTRVVFLIPGLLGFERFAAFSYFADRVVAALRASLEQLWGQSVWVVPVPVPPTSSLETRQRHLARALVGALSERAQLPEDVYLVGHSTGGVDAHLLAAQAPIAGGSWERLSPQLPALLKRLRKVVTLSSPHYGACIVRDEVARVLSHSELRGSFALLGLVGKASRALQGDADAQTFLNNLGRDLRSVSRFSRQLLGRWELLHDLEPSRDPSRRPSRESVEVSCFVTVAGTPRTTAPPARSTSGADPFFRELDRRASGVATGCTSEGPPVDALAAELRRAIAGETPVPVICNAQTELPALLGPEHNDGVVNAARQLLEPRLGGHLAGVVAADHFDVLGYYDRVFSADADGKRSLVRAGLLHSGSHFRDDQFFSLYGEVAQVLAR